MAELNFFNTYKANERFSKNRTLLAAGICSLLFVLIVGFYAVTELYLASVNNDINTMKAFINSSENIEKLKAINAKKKEIEIMNIYSSAVDAISTKLGANDKIKSTVIETMNTAIPKDVSFNTMALSQDAFQIQGSAPGWKSVAELLHNLNATGIFQKVWVDSIQSADTTSGNYTFSIRCTLKDVIKK